MSGICVFISSASPDMVTKKKQQKILMVLEGKKISFEQLDVASSCDVKDRMREIVGDPQARPPQICNGLEYCGDFDAFEQAIEEEKLMTFLKL